MSRKESIVLTLLLGAAVLLAFVSGYFLRDLVRRPEGGFAVLTQAEEILREHAYDPVPPDPALEYGMIRGMIEAYNDPFTSFFEPARHELQTNDLEGAFGGIGVTLDRDANGAMRLYPFPDSPAAASGVQAGDVLLRVDELMVTENLNFDELKAAIRGAVGTSVEIEVYRSETDQAFTFAIERQEVALPSVTWRLAPDYPSIGLIEVHLIAESTPGEIERAAGDLSQQGAEFFVLDLRGNGGGLLQAGIECARLFLADGLIIQQQYRDQDVITYEVEEPGALSGLPLIIWVDQNTASAAEIFAGALQMNGLALVGTHTFGKDAIQLVFELEDGSSIQVTAAKWWFPDLSFPNNGVGLLPDVEVSGGFEFYLEATIDWLNGTN